MTKSKPKKADKMVKVDGETHRRLKVEAAQQGTSIGELIKQRAKKPKVSKEATK